MSDMSPELVDRFRTATADLHERFASDRLDDDNVEQELRSWLDGTDRELQLA